MGFQIIGITTDRPSKIRETLTEHDFTYTVLSDSAMTGAAAFGLAYHVSDEIKTMYGEYGIDLIGSAGMDHGILPVPAVFLVGTDGLIYFQYVNPNHRIRLDADVFRNVYFLPKRFAMYPSAKNEIATKLTGGIPPCHFAGSIHP
jgi:peroxiredoxin